MVRSLTRKEAKREVYILAFKIWLSFTAGWGLIALAMYISPRTLHLDAFSAMFQFTLGAVCFLPIAISSAYKRWMYADASLIWKYPSAALSQIRANSSTEQSRWYWPRRPDVARATRIFPDYFIARTTACSDVLHTGGLIDNGSIDSMPERFMNERPWCWYEILVVVLLIVLIPVIVLGSCYLASVTSLGCDVFSPY